MELQANKSKGPIDVFFCIFQILTLCKAISYATQRNKKIDEIFLKFPYKGEEISHKYHNAKNLKYYEFVFQLIKYEVIESCHQLAYLGSLVAEKFKFIFVAFIDEFFITLDWNYNDEWKNNLLEFELFNTKISGEKIFDYIDEFLMHKASIGDNDMGALFYIILNLGFQGKFLGTISNSILLQNIKHKLFERVFLERGNLQTIPNLEINIDPIYISHISELDFQVIYYRIILITTGLFILFCVAIWYLLSRDIFNMSSKILSNYI